MRSKLMVVLIALIALVSAGALMTACSKGGDSPTMSSDVPTPVAANPQPATPPATGTPGILVELISSTFDPDRCTQLRDAEGNLTSYGKLSELVEVAKVTNNTARDVYAKPAIYHSDIAGCGALDSNPGGVTGLMDAANIPSGGSANWTHRFAIDENSCGSYQFDNDAKNGEISKPTLGGGAGGKVVNTGKNCPSCSAFDVQLTVKGEGLTRTVSVSFKGQKPSVKATVDFGDGTSAQVANNGSVEHTWGYGEFIVKATLNADNLECYKSVTVTNTKPCEATWTELEPEITYGEWGECKPTEASANDSTQCTTCSQSRSVRTLIKEQNSCTKEFRVKSDETTTEKRPCECPDPCKLVPAPVVQLSCTPNPYYDQSVECTATSSVAAKFDWDRSQIAAATFGSCNTTSKKTYSKGDLDNKSWKISVTATACDECKKTGSKSVDLIVNPPVGACYYKISHGSEAEKEARCEATKGGYNPKVHGVWLNFDHGALSNHCMFPVNGIFDNDFQLTPGQSDDRCLDKH